MVSAANLRRYRGGLLRNTWRHAALCVVCGNSAARRGICGATAARHGMGPAPSIVNPQQTTGRDIVNPQRNRTGTPRARRLARSTSLTANRSPLACILVINYYAKTNTFMTAKPLAARLQTCASTRVDHPGGRGTGPKCTFPASPFKRHSYRAVLFSGRGSIFHLFFSCPNCTVFKTTVPQSICRDASNLDPAGQYPIPVDIENRGPPLLKPPSRLCRSIFGNSSAHAGGERRWPDRIGG